MEKENRTKKVKSSNKINPPFGYFGSKNKIALEICSNLPPHNCWVEAFCGSAALTLRKDPAPIEVINDFDSEISNFFKQLRDNHKALIKAIELTPYAEEELYSARTNKNNIDELERARSFVVQAMFAINGLFGEEKGGFSYSDSYARNGHDARVNRWNNLPERLLKVVARLKKVRIENKDALNVIKRFKDRPATLIYLDPPYLGDRTNGYNLDANCDEFHTKLLKLANEVNCMIFISGYANELYDSTLTPERGWSRKEITTATKDSKGQSHERTEVVWMNRHYQYALEIGRVPVELTDDETKGGKLNPKRVF